MLRNSSESHSQVIGPGACIIRAGSAVLDHSLIYEAGTVMIC